MKKMIMLSFHIYNVNSGVVYVSKKNDFVDAFTRNDTIIVTQSLNITKNIKVNSYPNKIKVYGLDKSIYIDINVNKTMEINNIDFIEFKNITIIGRVIYKNIAYTNHENMNYCGKFDINNKGNKNFSENHFTNFSYITCTFDKGRENAMRFYNGTYTFENSTFSGVNGATDSYIKLSGTEKDSMVFNNCFFNGNYYLSSIIGFGCMVIIDNCEFINNFNIKKGSAITVRDGYYYMTNSTFKNCHTEGEGGVVYSLNNFDMKIDNLSVYNTTSIKAGGCISVINNFPDRTGTISNISIYGLGEKFPQKGPGSIVRYINKLV
ncbi:hypothetical protein PIROE2DRAFT_12131 [Piromyces sp. E2]|nr:hypothetical protein PIROE2DRAFT_12131 [Piromyces sp. E2]|eukprot:OUM61776.1 hypothetical protein PIROE2DRAFT_12131 [Piromyces sp. E2]